MPEHRDILLPVETATRELDAKLLLALFAAEAGFRCHIGVMNRIHAPGFPPSIYVSKSVRFAKSARTMTGFGHTVVAWDEEGLVRFRDDIHNSRIEPEAFSLPAMLFSWGASNSEVWRRHPFYNDCPIVESGNPRVDLLRGEMLPLYRSEAARLRREHGPFALFNTNFSFVNHFKAGGRPPKIAGNSYDGDAYLRFKSAVDAHKLQLFDAFQAGLPGLAEAIRPHRLVIRPHPSENRSAWVAAAQGLDNVSVIHEGAVVKWLLAAGCLIHNGCTSAVEASVLRRPVLAFRPVEDPELDFELPNSLSENFGDIAGLGARARDILDRQGDAEMEVGHSDLLKRNVAALDGPFACERIVEALGQLGDGRRSGPRLSTYGKFALRAATRALSAEKRRYERHKTGVEEVSVEKIASRAQAMGQALGRFQGMTFAAHKPGVVVIARGG